MESLAVLELILQNDQVSCLFSKTYKIQGLLSLDYMSR